MTMFKPRFMMTARERSRRDADYGELLTLRQSLPRMNTAQREREFEDARLWAAQAARQYFSALVVLWFGLAAAALVLMEAFATGNGALLFAGILVISTVLFHYSGLEQLQSMHYGARRAMREFFVTPESRFDD